jgi:ABC-type Mn2+/Zn2+ transport system permease subunit
MIWRLVVFLSPIWAPLAVAWRWSDAPDRALAISAAATLALCVCAWALAAATREPKDETK